MHSQSPEMLSSVSPAAPFALAARGKERWGRRRTRRPHPLPPTGTTLRGLRLGGHALARHVVRVVGLLEPHREVHVGAVAPAPVERTRGEHGVLARAGA